MKRVFIIGEPLEETDPTMDTGTLLMEAYQKRGDTVSWHTTDEIFTKYRTLYLDGQEVGKDDIVWIRCNPTNTIEFYELLRRLCHVDAKFVNSPQAILLYHDKLFASSFDDAHQYTATGLKSVKRCYELLMVDGFEKFVVKSPSRYGGKNIEFADNLAEIEQAYAKLVDDSGYVIIQGFVKQERIVDTRVLLLPEQVLGTINRVAKEGSLLCNLHSGASVEKGPKLSERRLEIVKNVQKSMRENNIFFVGLDFLGDSLVEVNVSCTTTVRQLNALEGGQFEFDMIEACDTFLFEEKP